MIINQKSKLSITVCTLNEEKNIEECIQSMLDQDPYEIIIVDASSEDKTKGKSLLYPVNFLSVERKGLAFQRNIAVKNSKSEFTAIIDADHRAPKQTMENLIIEMIKKKYDGIEAQILSKFNHGYWDYCMEQNFVLTHNFPGKRYMIGTPCIYKTSVLKENNFDKKFTGPSDDTDLCYRLIKKNYTLGVGHDVIYQVHRSSFGDFRKKWVWYGKGDAEFVWYHSERLLSILFHLLVNYPIKKNIKAIRSKKFFMIPFFLLCSFFRFYGFIKELLKIFFNLRTKRDIYKT